jgi:hypothetical protein
MKECKKKGGRKNYFEEKKHETADFLAPPPL